MKSDIDRLMQERELDALIVAGGEEYSVIRDYMTNGAHITRGLIIKKRGSEPVLIANAMEIEEAAASGLAVFTDAELGLMDLLQKISDPLKLTVAFWEQVLQHFGVHAGRIGLYGTGDLSYYIELSRQLEAACPQYRFVGEGPPTLFDVAFTTKDAGEIARLRSVAERTGAALEAVWAFISGHRLEGDTVVDAAGQPLTIGAVKRFIRRELLDRELEDTGMIFAQGRDAGFPHSRGQDNMPLQAGQSIVFDLFPRELGGGYFHDMTRTWCINHAPEAVQRAYDDVMAAFDIAVETFAVGKATHLMQEAVLDFLEGRGHATQRSRPGTMDGYVHSLGHGVGLRIHEAPAMSHLMKRDIFQVGNCVTIEPGLYYPDEGYGVRVEDLFIVSEAGELISLTPFRKDLVLPLKG